MQLDATKPVRAGEELAVERLSAYFREHWPEAGAGPLAVEQFPEGYSNLTYLLRCGGKEFVLRRPPFGNEVKAAHDMGREFRVLTSLANAFSSAPKPCLFCEDAGVLGAPFYVMERRHGVILRKQAPPELAANPATARGLSESFVDHLASLHALDYRAIGLEQLGRPEGFVARQVAGWAKRYQQAQTDDFPEMARAAEWLSAQTPPESGAALIHNDYKYDNLVLDPSNLTRIIAVLDWEMATIGDPLMDLGVSLAYWIEASDPEPMRAAAFGPTAVPGSLTRRQLLERYELASGRRVENAHYYYTYGLFKLAVIVQQIYARYARGHTRDPRFAHLNKLVHTLAVRACDFRL